MRPLLAVRWCLLPLAGLCFASSVGGTLAGWTSAAVLGTAAGVALLLAALSAERRQADGLRESEIKWRTIVETAPDHIITVDRQGIILSINRVKPGYELDQVVGTSSFAYQPSENHENVRRHLARVFEDGASVSYENVGHGSPGELHWYITRVAPIRSGDRVNSALMIATDITDRKRDEEARESLIRELETKNAELERFTYTVSHDLKSPLITIKGFLGLLEKDALAGNVDELRADVAEIASAADKMKRLLDDLLSLSRAGRAGEVETVALTDLARDAVALLAGRIAERGARVEVVPDLPRVRGNRTRLLEVFQNLVDNAVKFMGEQAAPRVEIGARREGSQTVCYVRDNGIGVEAQYREKIFGLFEQLDRRQGGTGVGLAIVKRVVEGGGGQVWVESEGTGKGATFWFTLPAGEKDE